MNRAFYIILIPVLLVAVGYILVFRSMGLSPLYGRLVLLVALLGAAIWWIGRRSSGKSGSGGR